MKRIFTGLICFLCYFLADAQIRYGVKAGVNLNKPVGGNSGLQTLNFNNLPFGVNPGPIYSQPWISDLSYGYKMSVDFHAGLILDFPLISKIHIRPDLLYSRKSAKYNKKRSDLEITEKLSADYLEFAIPVVYYHSLKNAAVYIGGGPYMSVGLSGSAKSRYFKAEYVEEQLVGLSKAHNNDPDWYRKSQFGLAISAGIDLPLGLTGELSVRRGFENANESKFVTPYKKLINLTYGISVGYLLGGKKS